MLDNSGPHEAIAPQVAALDRRYRALAAASRDRTRRASDRIARHCARLEAECRIDVTPRSPASVIRYEHPLNERIRTLMRLEDLYQRAQFFAAQADAPDHHAALLALFEITDVAARADLKTDLLQELERQKQLLAPLRANPAIETRVLEPLLADIDRASAALLAQTGKAGAHLRDNEWLMTIKQRTAIPGGVCEFDLPAYHYWLHGEPARAAERPQRLDRAVPADPRRPRDRPAAPARQRPRERATPPTAACSS